MRRTGVVLDGSSATSSNRLDMSGCPFAVVGNLAEDARDERADDVSLVVGGATVVRPWSCGLGGQFGSLGDAVGAQRFAHQRLSSIGRVDGRRADAGQG